MTEKIGLVKNLLTIIAIFAGIAEVSGTIVLPFITEGNQAVFVWFLMIFPSLLVAVFFLTLNFNSKALYAPSDYQNEDNYLQVHRYDKAKREEVLVNVPKEKGIEEVLSQLNELQVRFDTLSAALPKQNTVSIQEEGENQPIEPSVITQTSGEDLTAYEFLISSQLSPVYPFIDRLRGLDYSFNTYYNIGDQLIKKVDRRTILAHAAIWLGAKVPFEAMKDIILLAKEYYPHLKYILIDGDSATNYISVLGEDRQIFIGGATSTAREYGLQPLTDSDFKSIRSARSKSELFAIIRSKYPEA